ncbi:LHFPL tetraspan subfamily member 6 protein-like [Babylonia areolata]|uniref:LHFPL tetraspan subfamily member 6 protein-like n=1 Tax=Babylonia areolata TaxID=304850 RepID=UPI003FD246E4
MTELSSVGIVWLTLSVLAALGASSGFFLPYWLHGTYPPSPPPPPPRPSPTPSAPVPAPHVPPLNAPPSSTNLPPPTPVFLGIFRRCNYPRLVLSSSNSDQSDIDGKRRRRSRSDDDDNDNDNINDVVDGGGVISSGREGGVGRRQLGGGGGGGGGVGVGAVDLGPPRVEMVRECGRYTRFADIPSVWWQMGTVICGVGSAVALLVAMAGGWALCVRYVMTKGTAKVAALLQLLAGLLIGGGVALYPLGWDSQEVRQVCGPSASAFRLGNCELFWAFYLTASSGGLTLLCSILALCAPSSKADYT